MWAPRQRNFKVGVRPILTPVVKKFQLTLTQQARFGNIQFFGVIVRCVNVVGSGTLLVDQTLRTGLELAVFNDRKADPAPCQVRVINADALLYGCRVVWIGQVVCLGTLDFFDRRRGHRGW